MPAPAIYLVTASDANPQPLAEQLLAAGHARPAIIAGEQWLSQLPANAPCCLLVDSRTASGRRFFPSILQKTPAAAVVIACQRLTTETAVSLMEQGAATAMKLPVSQQRLQQALRRAQAIAQDKHYHLQQSNGFPAVWQNLSPEHRLVGRSIVEGKTTRTIAEVLKVSPRTIDRRRNELFSALGASDLIDFVWLMGRHSQEIENRRET